MALNSYAVIWESEIHYSYACSLELDLVWHFLNNINHALWCLSWSPSLHFLYPCFSPLVFVFTFLYVTVSYFFSHELCNGHDWLKLWGDLTLAIQMDQIVVICNQCTYGSRSILGGKTKCLTVILTYFLMSCSVPYLFVGWIEHCLVIWWYDK